MQTWDDAFSVFDVPYYRASFLKTEMGIKFHSEWSPKKETQVDRFKN